jgi:flagellar hook protein FlgE
MSLYGALRTSVSGMTAQTNRIGAVSENIANVSTTGYKRARTEFETLVGSAGDMPYYSGGVMTEFQSLNTEQGTVQTTGQATDLAIRGRGFFVVEDSSGTPGLTRAGAFIPDAQGRLVNAAGQYLLGYDLAGTSGLASNGLASLTRIDVNQMPLTAAPSTTGFMTANLPSDAAMVAAAALPSTNAAGATMTAKTSLVTYDNLGHKAVLDVYVAKTGTGQWEMSIYDSAGAPAAGGFPYAAGPLATATLAFDATGRLTAPASGLVAIPIPNGQTLNLDVSKATQLASPFAVAQASVDGHAPSQLERVDVGRDGTVTAVYKDGTLVPRYRIPLADVVSPDNLSAQSGNVWWETADSGGVVIGDALTGLRGDIVSGALESSTVDLASELTTMIEAQRGYTANSKVFQAGSELLDVLMTLKA